MAHEAPIGWREMSIGDFAKPVSTKNNSSTDIPVLSMTKYDGFVCSEEYFSKRVYSTNTSTYKIVRKGQFAYATIHLDEGSIDYLRDFDEGLVSPMYTVFEVNEDIVFRPFLHSLLKRKALLGHFNTLANGGVNRRKSISFRNLSDAKILIPPIPEQKKIAEVLSSVDEAIVATKAVIDQTKQVKKGLLQTLLTKGIGHTKFKQTELGEIPESWEALRAGELVKLTSGKLKSVKSLGDRSEERPYPAYGGNGIAGYDAEYLIDQEAIVIGRVGEYCGSIYRSSGKAWITDNALYTKEILKECDIDFLSLAFGIIPLENIRGGGGQPLVSQKPFYQQFVPFPPLEEQKEIATKIFSLGQSLQSYEEELIQLQVAKSGLMSDLLSGRKRVEV